MIPTEAVTAKLASREKGARSSSEFIRHKENIGAAKISVIILSLGKF